MKFIAFNFVVLGSLFFLYEMASDPADSSGATSDPASMQAQVAPQFDAVTEQLEVLAAIEAHMDERLEMLDARTAKADELLAELDERIASASRPAAASAAPSGPRPSKAVNEPAAPTAKKKTKVASADAASDPGAKAEIASVSAVKPRTPEPGGNAQTLTRAEEMWVHNERGVGAPVAAGAAVSRSSTVAGVSAGGKAAGTSEFSVAKAPAVAVTSPGSQNEADPVVIEGELMSAQQRRGALLELAEEMEMQFLVSSGLDAQ